MSKTAVQPARSLQLLLALLTDPSGAPSVDETEWDSVVRWARSSRLLATLHARVARAGLTDTLPERVRAAMLSEARLARHRAQMARFEMFELARALAAFDAPRVLLKGAAYLAQDLPVSVGRFLSDVDLLIPRSRLDDAEQLLVRAGWQPQVVDTYDEHYYRAWSHELPPMRFPGRSLELDLHHTILPITGRIRPDVAALFDAAIPVPGTPFHALCPADQVLHACAHLFQDSDLTHRLRDLADIDALLCHYASDREFCPELTRRARRHGLARPCWYALHYCERYFRTPVPEELMRGVKGAQPSAPVRLIMDRLVPVALPPVNPDRPDGVALRLAQRALLARSLWLRMPIWLLMYHSTMKFARRLRGRLRPQAA